MAPQQLATSYSDRLLAELEHIQREFDEVIRSSCIVPFVRNDPNSSVSFLGFPLWGWEVSSPEHEAARTRVLIRWHQWHTKFRLLFPSPVPSMLRRADEAQRLIETWLRRDTLHYSVPATLDEAVAIATEQFEGLRGYFRGLIPDQWQVRAIIDTNVLIDNPDVSAHTEALGRRYMVHVLPVVLREVDELKRSGRTPELREAAKRADRRLKGYRDNGDVLTGARVAGEVYVQFDHVDPKAEGLPSWLDLTVPDDRLVASALLLQSAHPASALYVVTNDGNLQTKLSAVGMPYVEGKGS